MPIEVQAPKGVVEGIRTQVEGLYGFYRVLTEEEKTIFILELGRSFGKEIKRKQPDIQKLTRK